MSKEARNYLNTLDLGCEIKQAIKDMEFFINASQFVVEMVKRDPINRSLYRDYLLTIIKTNMDNLITKFKE